ncbi:MAG: UDP-N-acetylglucosamine 2-epimerase (hydrolyzing) [Haliea sp.]|nr:MAG: UDP-N-acetylglucosamine 2-epimerase (hydrolyzing) [Haliea sp.]
MSGAPRRLIYLSGTRADFGLLQSTLQRVQAMPQLSVQILVTGMHLSAEHGHTVDEVRASGLPICELLPLDMRTRDGRSMAQGIADCISGVARVLERERPDLLLVLGDRGEMLAGAIAALHLGVPCVHIHGGERSGTVDEPVRHAISKLSAYHLVATEGSRLRLIAMGEEPDRIHVTGAPGLDDLSTLPLMAPQECMEALGLPAGSPFILSVFHPVVQQAGLAAGQTQAVLQALRNVGLPVLWVEPNADAGSIEILRALDETSLPAGSRRLAHVPRPLFAAALRDARLMVGNSSSGIIEAASFGTPVVNIGDRQRSRERSANVVDVSCEAGAIEAAVRAALSGARGPCDNVYGDGMAGARIAQLLARLPLGPAVLEKTNTY